MNVLAIGAHPDDIELGCAGALLAHRRRGDHVTLLVMTSGDQGPQVAATSRAQEQVDAAALLGADLCWGGFADGSVPSGREAVDAIQAVLDRTGADVMYTHAANDTHQDHRATSLASVAACRRATRVLHYESPTTVAFNPSLYIDIAGLVEAKVDTIRAHVSQVLKNGLVDLEAVEAQARYRGFGARLRYAEGFEVSRFLWDLSPTPTLDQDLFASIDLSEPAR